MKKDKEKEKDKKKKRQKAEDLPTEKSPVPLETESAQETRGHQALSCFLAVAGGKWKLRVLWALRSGESLRYGHIKEQIDGVTDMMLSQSLRELCGDGLLERHQYQEIPPKVEYRLTEEGLRLVPALQLLRTWEERYAEKEGRKPVAAKDMK